VTDRINFIYLSLGGLVPVRKEEVHVKWVPCHHGTARPQVADGGDGLQIWREGSCEHIE
jgi:hypothetical protein